LFESLEHLGRERTLAALRPRRARRRALAADVSDARGDAVGPTDEVTGRHTCGRPATALARCPSQRPPTQPMPIASVGDQATAAIDRRRRRRLTPSPTRRPSAACRSRAVGDRRWAGAIVLLALARVLVGGAYYGITLYQVHSTGQSDQARPVDAIVVMGARSTTHRPSPQLAAASITS
jgi:hypothetical protein